jgi:hypothetical protein
MCYTRSATQAQSNGDLSEELKLMHVLTLLDGAIPGSSLGTLVLGGLALTMVFVLVVFVETVALQLQSWGEFKTSLRASLWMNLASLLVLFGSLSLVTRFHSTSLFVSFALSVPIEAFVLKRLRLDQENDIWRAAILSNIASYLLLILPAYLISS